MLLGALGASLLKNILQVKESQEQDIVLKEKEQLEQVMNPN